MRFLPPFMHRPSRSLSASSLPAVCLLYVPKQSRGALRVPQIPAGSPRSRHDALPPAAHSKPRCFPPPREPLPLPSFPQLLAFILIFPTGKGFFFHIFFPYALFSFFPSPSHPRNSPIRLGVALLGRGLQRWGVGAAPSPPRPH